MDLDDLDSSSMDRPQSTLFLRFCWLVGVWCLEKVVAVCWSLFHLEHQVAQTYSADELGRPHPIRVSRLMRFVTGCHCSDALGAGRSVVTRMCSLLPLLRIMMWIMSIIKIVDCGGFGVFLGSIDVSIFQ